MTSIRTGKTFQEKSYAQHSAHFEQYGQGGKKEAHAKTWLANDTVDAWRHLRMYRVVDPVLTAEPAAKWLTVGDGRYGKDARYLLEKGCSALATDISDTLLEEAKQLGYIPEYKRENVESLSFGDSAFDYVLCKESYHHFPRPMLALYEMLRVARKGVVLIEPNDPYISPRPAAILYRKLLNGVKRLLGKNAQQHSFEESGNYVYRISRREIEKVAAGLDCGLVAFKGINDVYVEGVEYEPLSGNGRLQKQVTGRIAMEDLLCRIGLKDHGILAAIIFKQLPSEELLHRLVQEDYRLVHLPRNPYIAD